MGNELIKINGTKGINGKTVKVIEGGFGENQKCILVSDVAVQHELRLDKLNTLINNNITRFTEDDLKDFLKPSEGLRDFAKENGLITNNRVKNIFILSERGYTKLVAMMDNSNEKKWQVMDSLIDSYFTMRQIINSDEQLKANLLLSIYSGGQEGILASRQLTELEVKEATTPLLEKIEEDKPLVEFSNRVASTSDLIDMKEFSKLVQDENIKIGRNKMFEWLRTKGYLMKDNEPYQKYINQGIFKLKEYTYTTPYGDKLGKKTYVTGKGQVYLLEKLRVAVAN